MSEPEHIAGPLHRELARIQATRARPQNCAGCTRRKRMIEDRDETIERMKAEHSRLRADLIAMRSLVGSVDRDQVRKGWIVEMLDAALDRAADLSPASA